MRPVGDRVDRGARAVEPGLGEGVLLAGHCKVDGYANAYLTGQAYRAALIEAGVDLLQVQQILGHRSILTTARYTHLTSHTTESARTRIDALMQHFTLDWGTVR